MRVAGMPPATRYGSGIIFAWWVASSPPTALFYLLFRHDLVHFFREFPLTIRAFEEFASVPSPFGAEPVIVADGARLVDRLVIREEIAIGIAGASPEFALAFAAAALLNVADMTFRAFDAGRHRAGVFALR